MTDETDQLMHTSALALASLQAQGGLDYYLPDMYIEELDKMAREVTALGNTDAAEAVTLCIASAERGAEFRLMRREFAALMAMLKNSIPGLTDELADLYDMRDLADEAEFTRYGGAL